MPSMRPLSSTVRGDFLDALIDVEEHDEEHQRDAERDLRPDAEPEPQREDRRQHHARQRVGHLHIGIEHRGDPRLAREPEADHHAAERADREGENRLPQRDRQMLPDHAAGRTSRRSGCRHRPDWKRRTAAAACGRTPARWRATATARARRRRPAIAAQQVRRDMSKLCVPASRATRVRRIRGKAYSTVRKATRCYGSRRPLLKLGRTGSEAGEPRT